MTGTSRGTAGELSSGKPHSGPGELDYRVVADYTYDWETWVNPDGTYAYISPACARITGHGPEEFMADPGLLLSLVHPDDRQAVAHHLDGEQRREAGIELEWRVIARDGQCRWINHCCLPVYDAAGVFLGRRASNRDVTDRRRSEDQVRRQSVLLEAISQAQAAYIATGDSRATFGVLLEALIRLTESEYGFLDEVLRDQDGSLYKLSLALTDISWDEEARGLYEQLMARRLEFRNLANLAGAPATTGKLVIANDAPHDPRSGGVPQGHPTIRTYLGLPLYFGGELVGVAGVANRPGGYDEALAAWLEPFLATCAGIVHATRTRAREEAAVASIRAGSQAMSAILNASPESAFLMDVDGKVLAANETLARRLGRPLTEVVGANIYSFLPPELAAVRRRHVAEAVRTGVMVTFEDVRQGYEFEHRICPVPDENGRIERVAAFGVDLSPRHRLERILEEQRLRAVHADRLHALGEMAAGVAHELNQPLSGIRAFAEGTMLGLHRGWSISSEELQETLSQIVGQVDRITEIVDHMRAFARDPSTQPTAEFPLDETVRGALKLVGAQLREHGIAVSVEVASDLPLCRGWPHQLEQVVLNLLTNARDALDAARRTRAPAGGSTGWHPRIRVEVAIAAGGEIRLSVEDNGGGMDPEIADRVFEPFFTTKESGQGTGLGLAIARGLVDRHRGRLELENRPGDGATFTVFVPASA